MPKVGSLGADLTLTPLQHSHSIERLPLTSEYMTSEYMTVSAKNLVKTRWEKYRGKGHR